MESTKDSTCFKNDVDDEETTPLSNIIVSVDENDKNRKRQEEETHEHNKHEKQQKQEEQIFLQEDKDEEQQDVDWNELDVELVGIIIKQMEQFCFVSQFVCKKWKEAFRLFIFIPSSLNQMDKIPGIDKMEPLPLEFIQWTCHVKQMKPL